MHIAPSEEDFLLQLFNYLAFGDGLLEHFAVLCCIGTERRPWERVPCEGKSTGRLSLEAPYMKKTY